MPQLVIADVLGPQKALHIFGQRPHGGTQGVRLHLDALFLCHRKEVAQMAGADGPKAHEQYFHAYASSLLTTGGRRPSAIKPAPPGRARSFSSSASAPRSSLNCISSPRTGTTM